ncbi:TIM barrel protein [Agromyces bauzanensis]
MSEFTANISMLYSDLPVDDRPAAARRDGYDAVESWWPWAVGVPSEPERERWVRGIREAGVSLTLLNLWEGPAESGSRGLAGIRHAVEAFRSSADAGIDVARRADAPALHVLAGDGGEIGTLVDNLAWLSTRAPDLRLVLEYLNRHDHPGYPLDSPETVISVIDRVRDEVAGARIGMLVDTYHFGRAGIPLSSMVPYVTTHVSNIQVADSDRSCPGEGTYEVAASLALLVRCGYTGPIGAEFRPGTGVPAPGDLRRIFAMPEIYL